MGFGKSEGNERYSVMGRHQTVSLARGGAALLGRRHVHFRACRRAAQVFPCAGLRRRKSAHVDAMKPETGQTVGWFGGNDLRSAAAPFFGLSGPPLAINF